MNHSIEQEIEKYFGDVLRKHGFQPIYRETTSVGACIIYASGACRLRVVEERTDTNLAISGAEASLDASDEAGWFSLDQMLDFIEDQRCNCPRCWLGSSQMAWRNAAKGLMPTTNGRVPK